jgi:hypothetical protein
VSACAKWLLDLLDAGPVRVGQVFLWKWAGGGELCHERDFPPNREILQAFDRVEDARELAKYSADGHYRVLKSARDLRLGWILRLAAVEDLVRAGDLIYPAALGQWLAWERGEAQVVPLRETLRRQSGIYRAAQRLSDEGISEIVEARCRATCLRRVLWPEGRCLCPQESSRSAIPSELPLLCSEACQLLVTDAAARVAKTVAG